MEAVSQGTKTPTPPNKWIGFWGLKSSSQDCFLKEIFEKDLSLDPMGNYVVVSTSGTSKGLMLNPSNSAGMLLFFKNSICAEQYVVGRREWFNSKGILSGGMKVGKLCPIDQCNCCH